MRKLTANLTVLIFFLISLSPSVAQKREVIPTEKVLITAEEHNIFDMQGVEAIPSSNNSTFDFKYQIIFEMGGSAAFSSRQKVWLSDHNYWATSDPNLGNTWVVFDIENKNMILCDRDMNTAQVINKKEMMSASSMDVFLERSLKVSASPSFKSNRRKNKKIAGYKCKAYILETDEGTISIWVNDKIEINNKNIFASLLSLTGASSNSIPKGLIMEIQNDGVSKMTNMKIIKVIEKETSIDLAQFKVQERVVDQQFSK